MRENDGLRADLEEKSDQLDRLREIDYDIVTRTYEIDKIQEFLETIEEERLEKVGSRSRPFSSPPQNEMTDESFRIADDFITS